MRKYLLGAASLLVATTMAWWAEAQDKQHICTVWSWFIQSTMKESNRGFQQGTSEHHG